MERRAPSRLLPTVLFTADTEWMTRPTVLFPPEHGGRAARRSSVIRRVARLWQVLLLALAAAALTGCLGYAPA